MIFKPKRITAYSAEKKITDHIKKLGSFKYYLSMLGVGRTKMIMMLIQLRGGRGDLDSSIA